MCLTVNCYVVFVERVIVFLCSFFCKRPLLHWTPRASTMGVKLRDSLGEQCHYRQSLWPKGVWDFIESFFSGLIKENREFFSEYFTSRPETKWRLDMNWKCIKQQCTETGCTSTHRKKSMNRADEISQPENIQKSTAAALYCCIPHEDVYEHK